MFLLDLFTFAGVPMFFHVFIVFLDPWTYLIRSGLTRSSFSMSQMSRNTLNPSPQPRKLIFPKNKTISSFPGTDFGHFGTFETWKMKIGTARTWLNRPWMWCPLPLPGESIFRNLTFSKALDVVSIAPAGGTHFQKSDFFKSPGCGVHCPCRGNPFSEIWLFSKWQSLNP